MYPQTPEEIKWTNTFLAIFYGVLLILAYWGSNLLTGFLLTPFVASFMSAMENTFRDPWVAFSMQNSLYLAESNWGNLPPEKLPEGAKRIVSLWKWGGLSWNKVAEIENLDGLYVVENQLVGVRDRRLILFQNLTPGEPGYELNASYSIASCPHRLAVLWSGQDGFFYLDLLNKDLELVEQRRFKNTEALDFSMAFMKIKIACLDEAVHVCWTPNQGDPKLNRIKPDIYCSPILKEELGEKNLFPYDATYYKFVQSTGRIWIISDNPDYSHQTSKETLYQVTEFDGKEWRELPDLVVPRMSGFGLTATDFNGELHAFYSGFRGASWQVFDGEKWNDRNQELHGNGGKGSGGMPDLYVKMMSIIPVAWLITCLGYGIVVLLVHFHFHAKKDPKIVAGQYQGELAPVMQRSAAYAIDRLLVDTPRIAFLTFFILRFEDIVALKGSALSILLGIVGAVLISTVYFLICEGLWGKTLGKKIMGLRVVAVDGQVPSFLSIFLRNFLRIIDSILIYLPVVVSVAATQKYQRIGDLAGKTMVVKEPWLRAKTLPAVSRPSVPSKPAATPLST